MKINAAKKLAGITTAIFLGGAAIIWFGVWVVDMVNKDELATQAKYCAANEKVARTFRLDNDNRLYVVCRQKDGTLVLSDIK